MAFAKSMNRRAFLAVSASMAGALASSRNAAAKPAMTMNLSCGRVGIRANQEEALALAAEHGFNSIDPDAAYLSQQSDEGIAAFREKMKAKNIVWAAGGVPVDFRKDGAAFNEGMKNLPDYAKTLHRAGVTRVGTWLMPGSNEYTHREFGKMHAQRLRSIADVYADHDIFMGLEYVGTKSLWTTFQFPWVHTMREAAELLADIDRKNAGYVLDSWHWYHANETGDDIRSLKAEQIAAVDLNDAPAGLEKIEMNDTIRDLPCATGVIPIAEFMRALADIGYDGPVRAEPFKKELGQLPPQEAAARTAEAMRAAWAHLKE